MKPKRNERLIPIISIVEKGKWDEYCELDNISDKVYSSVKMYPIYNNIMN